MTFQDHVEEGTGEMNGKRLTPERVKQIRDALNAAVSVLGPNADEQISRAVRCSRSMVYNFRTSRMMAGVSLGEKLYEAAKNVLSGEVPAAKSTAPHQLGASAFASRARELAKEQGPLRQRLQKAKAEEGVSWKVIASRIKDVSDSAIYAFLKGGSFRAPSAEAVTAYLDKREGVRSASARLTNVIKTRQAPLAEALSAYMQRENLHRRAMAARARVAHTVIARVLKGKPISPVSERKVSITIGLTEAPLAVRQPMLPGLDKVSVVAARLDTLRAPEVDSSHTEGLLRAFFEKIGREALETILLIDKANKKGE